MTNKRSNNPCGLKQSFNKKRRKEVYSFKARAIELDPREVREPFVRDLCVGGYRKGKKVSA